MKSDGYDEDTTIAVHRERERTEKRCHCRSQNEVVENGDLMRSSSGADSVG